MSVITEYYLHKNRFHGICKWLIDSFLNLLHGHLGAPTGML
uniref:Uncharacterized protein n=1 Tax=Anguilla anguilla TaxID=7936 RepID=A0A0E9R9P4_ANGAN